MYGDPRAIHRVERRKRQKCIRARAYYSAVATETAAYIEAKEMYEEAKEFMDINDPGEREVIMQLLKNVRDGEANMVTIATELENHFGISG